MNLRHRERLLVAAVAAVLIAAGLSALLLGSGLTGNRARHTTVITNREREYADRHGGWIWPVVGGTGTVLAAGGLAATILILRRSRVRHVVLDGRSATATRVAGPAIVQVVRDQIRELPEVAAVTVALLGTPNVPYLSVLVDLTGRADVAGLRLLVEQVVLEDLREALGFTLPVHVQYALAPPTLRSVL